MTQVTKIGVNGMEDLPFADFYSYDIVSDTITAHDDLKEIREKNLPYVNFFGWGEQTEFKKNVTKEQLLRLRALLLFNRDKKVSLIVAGDITYIEYVSVEVFKHYTCSGIEYEYKVNSYKDLVKISQKYHIKLLDDKYSFETNDISLLTKIRPYVGAEGKIRSGFTIVY